jgi:DNA-binding transcriptional LysR family regulator
MPRNKSSPKGITQSAAVNPISIGWALCVADHLSFRGAARELRVRQGAVSRRVRQLEDALGVSLFERSPHGLNITNAGAEFIREVREGFRSIEHATRMASEAGRGSRGRLIIGIQPSMGAGFLRELIQVYSQRYPEVAVQLVEGAPPAEHISLVRRRELDVAFVADTAEAADCDVAPLWNERLFVVLPQSHALGERTAIDWNDLQRERFIIRQAKCDPELCERIIKRLAEQSGSPIIQKLDVGRETVMHLVGIGQGVSITSEATVATSFPNVVFRPISGGDETVQFSAVWLAENDNPALRRLLSLAKVHAKQKRRDASSRTNLLQSDDGGITLSLAFVGALARKLGLST